MATQSRPLAIVTATSTGMGYELAKIRAAMSHVMTSDALAEQHRKMAEARTAAKS